MGKGADEDSCCEQPIRFQNFCITCGEVWRWQGKGKDMGKGKDNDEKGKGGSKGSKGSVSPVAAPTAVAGGMPPVAAPTAVVAEGNMPVAAPPAGMPPVAAPTAVVAEGMPPVAAPPAVNAEGMPPEFLPAFEDHNLLSDLVTMVVTIARGRMCETRIHPLIHFVNAGLCDECISHGMPCPCICSDLSSRIVLIEDCDESWPRCSCRSCGTSGLDVGPEVSRLLDATLQIRFQVVAAAAAAPRNVGARRFSNWPSPDSSGSSNVVLRTQSPAAGEDNAEAAADLAEAAAGAFALPSPSSAIGSTPGAASSLQAAIGSQRAGDRVRSRSPSAAPLTPPGTWRLKGSKGISKSAKGHGKGQSSGRRS
jgi:hypothetical protein